MLNKELIKMWKIKCPEKDLQYRSFSFGEGIPGQTGRDKRDGVLVE
jgi:hypothetical protein